MAAIFQIRRGTSNVSLTEGELYLHQGSGSLQFGSGSTKYNTLTLDAPVKGDINLIGNISASGDVRIGGNIYLGNDTASAQPDSISALGIFTTNLVPNGNIDLGTTSAKWNNVYGNSIWGAISASNGVVSGSAQFTGVLSSLNDFTASQLVKDSTLQTYTTSVDSKFTTIQSLTASNLNRLSRLEESTSSLNEFTASQNTKDTTLGLYTASIDSKFTTLQSLTASNLNRLSRIEESTASLNLYTASIDSKFITLQSLTASNLNRLNIIEESTASLNLYTSSASNRLSRLEESTSSLNSYTASLKAAITASGTDVIINGNLTVKGTTTQIDSTTINIGDNIIELNYGGSQTTSGIITRDATGTSTTSGSLIWDSANGADLWKAGKLGSEAKILTDGMGVISGSGQLGNYETTGRGIVSGSSQVTPLLPTGIVSGSIQVLGGTGIVSGSSQITYTGISSIPAGIVSGSSQITYGNISSIPIGIVSGSSQVTPLLPTGIVSGSIQVLGSSTIHSGSTGDYQFNTIGVGVAPSSLYKGNFYGKVILQSGINNASGSQSLIFAYPGLTNTLTHSIWSGHDASVQNFNKLDFYIAKTDGTQKNVLSLRSSQPTVIGLETGLGLDVNGNLNVTGSINSSTITIVSGSGQVVGILSSLNTYTGSNDTTNTTQNTRLTRIEESTSSLNTFSASMNAFYNQFTASAVGFSASVDGRLDQLEYTASYGSAATIAGQFGALQTVTASLMLATGSLQNHTASTNNRLNRLEESTSSLNEFSASENTKSETLRLYTASVDAKFTTLQSLTASNLNRLSRIEESTASLNLFTQSLSTTYEARATAVKTIFSGSSQVSYVGLSNIPSGIISSSAQIDTLFNIDGIVSGSSQINFTQLSGISANIISASSDTSNVDMIITGGSISANLYGGVVSGSAQVTTILTSLNSFSASNGNTSLNAATSSYETTGRSIVSGSSQVNFTQLSGISNGIVSSSAQITPLLPWFKSNQHNIN